MKNCNDPGIQLDFRHSQDLVGRPGTEQSHVVSKDDERQHAFMLCGNRNDFRVLI